MFAKQEVHSAFLFIWLIFGAKTCKLCKVQKPEHDSKKTRADPDLMTYFETYIMFRPVP